MLHTVPHTTAKCIFKYTKPKRQRDSVFIYNICMSRVCFRQNVSKNTMLSYLSIAWNINFNRSVSGGGRNKQFNRGRVSVKTKCMVIYLYSTSNIYSCTWKDTSIVSGPFRILLNIQTHPNFSVIFLTCLVQIFKFIDQSTWLDFKLIDGAAGG